MTLMVCRAFSRVMRKAHREICVYRAGHWTVTVIQSPRAAHTNMTSPYMAESNLCTLQQGFNLGPIEFYID